MPKDRMTDDIWEVKKLIHRAKGLILIGDRDCLSCLDEASELLTKIEQKLRGKQDEQV